MGQVSPAAAFDCTTCGNSNVANSKYCAQCGKPLQPIPHGAATSGTAPAQQPASQRHLADPLIGVVVAERYRILELLGRGGMGVVYKVEHARIGKLMALKLLTGEVTRDTDQVQRFRREALMVSKLSHPNTVQVFDFGVSDGLTYLAMEYLRGIDLGHLIEREGPLGPVRTAKLMIQVCSSLAEAHEKDIVHRDLKPENIIVLRGPTGEDFVKVLDFGLAKLRESKDVGEVTLRGSIVGTPYYMSPEQVQGENVDQRSDVYALGALMHVCLTTEPVFDAPTPLGVLSKQLTEEPRSPSGRFPQLQIPLNFSQIVMRCLSKQPGDRFQTVKELQAALVTALCSQGQTDAEELLDFAQLRELESGDAATRDEVEDYERKLRRRGHIVYAVLAVVLMAGGLVGVRAWSLVKTVPEFLGEEFEPNDKASQATPVPFGKPVRGQLGKRLDRERSDRDFYRFEVPASASSKRARLSLEVSPLGNMALCAWLYRAGHKSPLARYCTGSVDNPVLIPQLELTAGDYLVAVMQDRTEYMKGQEPPVYENVSDYYTLTLTSVAPRPELEVEPNGHTASAERLEFGQTRRASFSFARDTDVFCASPKAGLASFEVSDGLDGKRQYQAVLQVVPIGGPADEVPVRVHHESAEVKPTERDQLTPWRSPVVDLARVRPACIEVSLEPNPWAPTPHPVVAPPGFFEYSVTLVERPPEQAEPRTDE